MHTAIAELEQAQIRSDIPAFRPGDTLKVHVRVTEGNRSRIQVFQGIVIRRQGGGARETFTVRKISYGVGVERTFPVHTPAIEHDRGRDQGSGAPGQAVLPALPARQGRQDQGAPRAGALSRRRRLCARRAAASVAGRAAILVRFAPGGEVGCASAQPGACASCVRAARGSLMILPDWIPDYPARPPLRPLDRSAGR